MEHSDLYLFATHFWWLIFPLMWMIAAFFRISARHRESQRILDMIQSYTAQGKEPPATLTDLFRAPYGRGWDRHAERYYNDRYAEPYYTYRLWRRFFLFAFLCAAFAAATWWHMFRPGDIDHRQFGWLIVALVMGALAFSNLVALLIRPRLPPDQK